MRNPLVPLLLTSVLVIAVLPVAPGATQTPVALISGVVTNKLTGSPVKHAHVSYIRIAAGANEAGTPISTDSDAQGRFSIQVQAGTYRLWVERPGFARQAYGARTPEGAGTTLTLVPGQQMRDLTLKMVPLGAIFGRILDEDGDPLQGVGVQLLRYSFATGKKQLIPVAAASSNDRGEYRAYGLPAGRYFLLAKPPGAPLTRPMEKGGQVPEAQEPLAALYFPGALDLAAASQISLAEGGEAADVDFRLKKVHAVTVRGRLLSPIENFAASQIQVVLAHSNGQAASYIDRAAAVVDKASGRFELRGVAPGEYWLVASQLYAGRTLGGRVLVEVSAMAPPENLTVTLRAAMEITGRVELENGASLNFQKISARLTPSEGLALGPQPTGKIGLDGSLQISGVIPGIWDFTLDTLPEGIWIKSATFGDVDALDGELQVPDGPPGLLHVVLAGNGAQVSGLVTEEGQPRRAFVVLAPASTEQRRSAQMFRSTSAQDQGTFVFKGVRPGSYKLFAFDEIEPLAWLDPDFLKPVEAQGEPVTVADGERVSRQLLLVPPEMLVPGR